MLTIRCRDCGETFKCTGSKEENAAVRSGGLVLACAACGKHSTEMVTGRPRRQRAVSDVNVVVRVTPEERAAFDRAAEPLGVSQWLRGLGRKAAGLD